jgi:hypothetical protein
VPILERHPLNPFTLNNVSSAIPKLTDFGFALAVLAIEVECDSIFQSGQRRSGIPLD